VTVERISEPIREQPAGDTASGSSVERPQPDARLRVKRLVVVDRRPIIAESLCLWIGSLDAEYRAISANCIEAALRDDWCDEAAAIIFATSAIDPCQDLWLRDQIRYVRSKQPGVPLVLITDVLDTHLVESSMQQLHISGYIPAHGDLELVATALRLVIAGGRYVPRESHRNAVPVTPAPAIQSSQPACAPCVKLTGREHAVLSLLEQGLPNKLIGYRLGMSQSTVKAHVHNVIAKLGVRNRTEAAVARYASSAPQFVQTGVANNAEANRANGCTPVSSERSALVAVSSLG
jgi:DNA-binding NarL/FixJ family response regulator